MHKKMIVVLFSIVYMVILNSLAHGEVFQFPDYLQSGNFLALKYDVSQIGLAIVYISFFSYKYSGYVRVKFVSEGIYYRVRFDSQTKLLKKILINLYKEILLDMLIFISVTTAISYLTKMSQVRDYNLIFLIVYVVIITITIFLVVVFQNIIEYFFYPSFGVMSTLVFSTVIYIISSISIEVWGPSNLFMYVPCNFISIYRNGVISGSFFITSIVLTLSVVFSILFLNIIIKKGIYE